MHIQLSEKHALPLPFSFPLPPPHNPIALINSPARISVPRPPTPSFYTRRMHISKAVLRSPPYSLANKLSNPIFRVEIAERGPFNGNGTRDMGNSELIFLPREIDLIPIFSSRLHHARSPSCSRPRMCKD